VTASGALKEAISCSITPAIAHGLWQDALADGPDYCAVGSARPDGTIDRLSYPIRMCLLVDYKTNRRVPDTPGSLFPKGFCAKMGAYAAGTGTVFSRTTVFALAIFVTRTAAADGENARCTDHKTPYRGCAILRTAWGYIGSHSNHPRAGAAKMATVAVTDATFDAEV